MIYTRILTLLAVFSAFVPTAPAQILAEGEFIPCGVTPAKVVAAELDGEPGIDLAIASNDAGAIAILLNNGDGTFGDPLITVVDPAVDHYTLCAGDLDGDLDTDLVVGRGTAISILVNDGAAGFTPGAELPTNGFYLEREACAIDIDDDGDVDLIWGEFLLGGGLWLALNEGGTFATPVELVHSHVGDPLVALLNDDAYLDIAFHRGTRSEVTVLLGQGDGTFLDPVTYEVPTAGGVADITAADLDGDTDLDLVVINLGIVVRVQKLTNLGDGTFGEIGIIADPGSYYGRAVIAPDLDGSGCGGVVPVCEEPWHEIWTNDCAGVYTPYLLYPYVIAQDAAAADLDGDGGLDIVYATSEVDSVLVHLNTSVVSSVEEDTPGRQLVLKAWPNPFNPRVNFSFNLASSGPVELRVFDTRGMAVATVYKGWMEAGPKQLTWDARSASSGVYMAQITSSRVKQTVRLVLIR